MALVAAAQCSFRFKKRDGLNTANVKPNLSISSNDITFSNSTPTVGETITITVNVKNTGPGQAPSTGSGQVTVQFYDGDPSSSGVLIEETTISSIPAYGSEQTSITYTIPTASSKTIFIKIDPLNVIDELICSKNDYKKLSKLLQKIIVSMTDFYFHLW